MSKVTPVSKVTSVYGTVNRGDFDATEIMLCRLRSFTSVQFFKNILNILLGQCMNIINDFKFCTNFVTVHAFRAFFWRTQKTCYWNVQKILKSEKKCVRVRNEIRLDSSLSITISGYIYIFGTYFTYIQSNPGMHAYSLQPGVTLDTARFFILKGSFKVPIQTLKDRVLVLINAKNFQGRLLCSLADT